MRRNSSVLTFNLSTVAPHLPFIIFATLFIIGVFTGCFTVGRFEVFTDYSAEKINDFISIRNDFEFFSVLKDSFFRIFPIYLIVFLCGTSVVGCIASPLILVYNGIVYGFLSGYLCSTHRLEGIMFNALILIPSVLVSTFGLILLAKEAFFFSYTFAGICIKSNKPVNIYSRFKGYCIKSLVSVVAVVLATFLDMSMSVLFISYFNF